MGSALTAATELFVDFFSGVLGFSRDGEYMGEEAESEAAWWAQTQARRGPRAGRAWALSGHLAGSPAAPLLAPSSLRRNKTLGFCPVQFREYLLYNFSEIQKQQKTGTGTAALVNRLVPEKC